MNFDDLFDEDNNRIAKLDYASKILKAEKEGRVLDRNDPMTWVPLLIRNTNLYYYQLGFYDWFNGAYRQVSDEAVEAKVAEILTRCYTLTKKEVHIPFKPKKKDISEAISAIRLTRLLDVEPPCWIGTRGLPPSEIVSFPNGLLHVGSKRFTKPTPDFFTLCAQEFDYDPNAPEPKLWKQFLHTVWPDDEESRCCLMEFFGYLLSGDSSMQKILTVIGPPGSGKSTIMRVMEHVLGKDNVVSTDSESMSDRFGLESLLGKSIAFLPDETFDYSTSRAGIEKVKRISGCDTVAVRPMRKGFIHRKLPIRFVISTNDTPRLRGSAEAMLRRFLMIRTPPFSGKVNVRLTEALCKEASGILNYAIESLEGLIARGDFVQPESGKEDLLEVRSLGDNVAAFIDDCLVIDEEAEVDSSSLYIHYTTWCEANGEHVVNSRMFGTRLRSKAPNIKRAARRSPVRHRVYEGIRLKRDEE